MDEGTDMESAAVVEEPPMETQRSNLWRTARTKEEAAGCLSLQEKVILRMAVMTGLSLLQRGKEIMSEISLFHHVAAMLLYCCKNH